MPARLSLSAARPLAILTLTITALLCSASPARAGFHLWSLSEVYTNASGTLQFIELIDNSGGGQQFVGGFNLTVSNVGNSITHSFTFPSSLPSDSANHRMLLGTAGLQAAGSPMPDFIIPNNFLFAAGGSISFFNASGAYTALPTDGTLSRTWGGGNAVNSPANFAGQTGSVPAPGAVGLIAAAGGAAFWRRSRRPTLS